MKLYNIKNLDLFFKTVKECKGRVELVTSSGIYNLKSKLSQVTIVAKEFSNNKAIKEIEIKLAEPSDCNKFVHYCINT